MEITFKFKAEYGRFSHERLQWYALRPAMCEGPISFEVYQEYAEIFRVAYYMRGIMHLMPKDKKQVWDNLISDTREAIKIETTRYILRNSEHCRDLVNVFFEKTSIEDASHYDYYLSNCRLYSDDNDDSAIIFPYSKEKPPVTVFDVIGEHGIITLKPDYSEIHECDTVFMEHLVSQFVKQDNTELVARFVEENENAYDEAVGPDRKWKSLRMYAIYAAENTRNCKNLAQRLKGEDIGEMLRLFRCLSGKQRDSVISYTRFLAAEAKEKTNRVYDAYYDEEIDE